MTIPETYVCPNTVSLSQMEQLTSSEIRTAQEEDPIIGEAKAGCK